MFKLWIEWDAGQDALIFTSKEKVKNWVNANATMIEAFQGDQMDGLEGPQNPYDYFEWQGLLSLQELTVV